MIIMIISREIVSRHLELGAVEPVNVDSVARWRQIGDDGGGGGGGGGDSAVVDHDHVGAYIAVSSTISLKTH